MKIPLHFKIYFSPFKRPILNFYFGKIALGLPYYLPRYWRKATPLKAIEEARKEMKRVEENNANEKRHKLTVHSFGTLYDRYLNSLFAYPLKFGFSYNNLGWKTKYDSFRFEYAPRYSFVVLGYQFCLTFYAEDEYHYWECFLAYYYDTDKTKSPKERLKEAKYKHSQTWTDGDGVKTDYWDEVVKSKYL